MLKLLYLKANDFFTKGHERSLLAKKNVVAMFLMRGVGILISLLLVPMTINYVNATEYGIWLTLSSIVAWFSFFDVGLGYGLQNKLAEAVALNKRKMARVYISTTYAMLCIIIGGVLLLFFLVNHFLNWAKLLNTPAEMASQLNILAIVVFSSFCIQFVLKLVSTVLNANQRPASPVFFSVLGNTLSLLIIFILTKTTKGNLLYLGMVLSITPILSLIASSLWFYTQDYKDLAPSFKYIRFRSSKNIVNLGLNFFLIQIGAMMLLSTDNIVIAQLFGPREVVPYSIAYKYFGIMNLVFAIIVAPLWPSITDANAKQDTVWIKNSIKKLNKLCIPFFLLLIGMIIFSNTAYRWWVGDKIQVPMLLSILMGVYCAGFIYSAPFGIFLNGVGKVKIQLILSVMVTLINIPVSVILSKYIGVSGVILGTIVCLIPTYILTPMQYYKIINKTATGIWNR